MGVADEKFLESDFTHRRGFLVWWDRGCVERDLKKLVCEGKNVWGRLQLYNTL